MDPRAQSRKAEMRWKRRSGCEERRRPCRRLEASPTKFLGLRRSPRPGGASRHIGEARRGGWPRRRGTTPAVRPLAARAESTKQIKELHFVCYPSQSFTAHHQGPSCARKHRDLTVLGRVATAKDGNLVLRDQAKNRQLWSTNVSISSNSTMAIIRDSGSLELTDASNPSMVYWQSIDHPTDTWLPGGKLRLNKVTGVSNRLVSWKNSADPSPGLFSLELDPNGTIQFLLQWNESVNYWTSSPWNGNYFSHMPEAANNLLDFQFVNKATESYLFYSMKDDSVVPLSRLIMDLTGQIKLLIWDDDSYQQWLVVWAQPRSACDVYALCGAYGSCNPNDLPHCHCVKGFSQKFQSDWDLQDYSGGCKRNTPLQCQTNSTSAQAQSDKFYVMEDVLLPDNAHGLLASSPQECQVACLKNCSCNAYTYNFSWHGDLVNLQEQYIRKGGGTLLLRFAASELPDQQRTS